MSQKIKKHLIYDQKKIKIPFEVFSGISPQFYPGHSRVVPQIILKLTS